MGTGPLGADRPPSILDRGLRVFADVRAGESATALILLVNVFLLLAAGLLVMLTLYTGWGLWEIFSLPAGRLP